MSTTEVKGNEKVRKLIECPVCFNRIIPPVKVCSNGHAICRNCIGKLVKCPLCSSDFTPNKNTTLDNILEECIYPCTYSGKGCSAQMSLIEIEEHEKKYCKHRIIKCQLDTEIEKCLTEVLAYNFQSHVLGHHVAVTIKGTMFRRIPLINGKIFNVFKHIETSCVIIEAIKVDQDLKKLSINYQLAGNAEQARKWYFDIEFQAENIIKRLKYRSLLSPLWMDEKYDEETYLELSFKMVNKFIINDCLEFFLKLEKITTFKYLRQVFKSIKTNKHEV